MYFGHAYNYKKKNLDFLALMLLCQRRGERSIPISIFPKVELESSSSRGIRTKFLHQTHTHTTTTTSFFSALKFDTN